MLFIDSWQVFGETGILTHCWWEYTLVQSPASVMWQYLWAIVKMYARYQKCSHKDAHCRIVYGSEKCWKKANVKCGKKSLQELWYSCSVECCAAIQWWSGCTFSGFKDKNKITITKSYVMYDQNFWKKENSIPKPQYLAQKMSVKLGVHQNISSNYF